MYGDMKRWTKNSAAASGGTPWTEIEWALRSRWRQLIASRMGANSISTCNIPYGVFQYFWYHASDCLIAFCCRLITGRAQHASTVIHTQARYMYTRNSHIHLPRLPVNALLGASSLRIKKKRVRRKHVSRAFNILRHHKGTKRYEMRTYLSRVKYKDENLVE